MTIHYAISWILELNLETTQFPGATPKYLQDYHHLVLQH
jgi:hypothetical protein